MVFEDVKIPVKDYSGQFGNTAISPDGTNVVKFAKLIPHEGYNESNFYIHDIGLIKLAKPISNPPEGFRVKLPHSGSSVLSGSPAVAAGWGINKTGETEAQKILQEVDVFALSAYECKNVYKEIQEILLKELNQTLDFGTHETHVCSSHMMEDIEGPDDKGLKGICR